MLSPNKRWLRPLIFLVILALLVLSGPAASGQSEGQNQVGLVIHFGDGNEIRQCLAFDEDKLTGLEALQRSGLPLVIDENSGLGSAVCKIGAEGCDASQDCFCQCQGSPCFFWNYWHLQGNDWQISGAGAADYDLTDGDVDGWSWGDADPPDSAAFAEICQPPATDTPTPTLTNTPPPTATQTPEPTNTPRPTDTPTPQPTPSVSFGLDVTEIVAGACATLRWEVHNAQAVFLNGQGVTGAEARQVCPETGQTYRLRVVGQDWEKTFEAALTVVPASPTATAAATFTPIPPSATPQPAAPAPPLSQATVETQPAATETPLPASTEATTTTPVPTEASPAAPAPSPTAPAIASLPGSPTATFVTLLGAEPTPTPPAIAEAPRPAPTTTSLPALPANQQPVQADGVGSGEEGARTFTRIVVGSALGALLLLIGIAVVILAVIRRGG